MAIVHKLMTDGGFVCGDTVTGRTAYAYPTSPHATKARKMPGIVAKQMMRNLIARSDLTDGYDARNWGKLGRQPLPPLTAADHEARERSIPR